MTNEHPIQGLMSTAMQNIKEMVDVNTIVGDAVQAPDGTIIIPISKVGFGFVATGMEYGRKVDPAANAMFGGGSGAGISIKPVGFLVVGQGQIKLLPIEGSAGSPFDKLVEMVPELVEKVNGKIQKSREEKQMKKEIKEQEKTEASKDQIVKSADVE